MEKYNFESIEQQLSRNATVATLSELAVIELDEFRSKQRLSLASVGGGASSGTMGSGTMGSGGNDVQSNVYNGVKSNSSSSSSSSNYNNIV